MAREGTIERRLAAILAADIAGYSRLMGQDEGATLRVLKAHRRELVDPTIARHHGRIVKTTGDGLLATFSCSQAVDVASFTMAVSWAGVDAVRDVQIVRRMGQGLDHPVLATFPESEYLKGLLCRVA
jgi:adenylate cyclase